MSSQKEGWLVAALDSIAQFRATKEPLKNVVRRLSMQRKLGPRERARMSDAVFAWSRAYKDVSTVGRKDYRSIDEAIIMDWLQSDKKQVGQSFPDWFIAKLSQAYGEKAPALLESLSQRAGPTLAFDPRHITLKNLCDALDNADVSYGLWPHFEEAVCIKAAKFRIEALPPAIGKHLWLMDPASQLVAHLAHPGAGKKILDACAGGGGKTQFLLSRGAKVTAMDVSETRIGEAKKRCRGEAVHFVVGDATKPELKAASLEHILVDAPCSGTGTIRRAPDLLLRLDETAVAGYVTLQRQIIRGILPILKKGGKLVYATCSILPEENGEQAKWAQKDLGLKLISERQLLPSLDDSDGFYVAIFQKTGD